MSLDTLLTEAAGAGGPPRFTEDDVAARVTRRHKRRRAVVTVGAALVVLAGAAAGIALAARGGDSGEIEPAEPHEVPITAEALVGSRWVQVTEPGASGQVPWLEFGADGQARAEGCGHGTGPWSVRGGELALELSRGTLELCTPNDIAYHSPATLFDDGTLRFDYAADAPQVRPDDPRMVELRRVDQIGEAPTSREQLLGIWSVGPSIQLEFTDRYVGAGCTIGRWQLDGEVLSVDPVDTDCTPTLPPAVEEELRAWLPFLDSARVVGDRLLLTSPDVSLWLAPVEVEPAVELAGTRWIGVYDEVEGLSEVPWVDFDDDEFVMSTSCRATGTYDLVGSAATFQEVHPSDGGCDAMFPEGADLDGDLLTVHFGEVPMAGGGTAPFDRTYVRLDSLPTPTVDDLPGDWSSPWIDQVGAARALVTFDPDGTVIGGNCATPLAWEIVDGTLRSGSGDDACHATFGFPRTGESTPVHLDGDALYLGGYGDDVVFLLVRGDQQMRDTSISVSGPRQSLADAYAELGVETCCDGGFVWEGRQVQVNSVLSGLDDSFSSSESMTVLDGRATLRGPNGGDLSLKFACGGYHFILSAHEEPVPREPLLGAGEALIDVLPCTAEPTT